MKSEGKSIILSTHNMQSVEEICDDVVLLHKSKLIASDSVENLRSSVKNGLFSIRFSGNMIALANALWTDFELIETKELGNNRFQVLVRKRGERTFEDLINNLMGKLTLEAVEEKLPSMQEVFMSLITKEEVLHAE
jgi:ABC-2 type transport system ATP-binding protein